MGCDIEYYLDHDFIGLSAAEFLAEFKKRIAPLSHHVAVHWHGEDRRFSYADKKELPV